MATPDRIRVGFNGVGTSWVTKEVTGVYPKFLIIRARAEIVSGAGTEVALRVAETDNLITTLQIPIQYALDESPLDSREGDILVHAKRAGNKVGGSIWIAVKVNSGSNSVVYVNLDIEKKA